MDNKEFIIFFRKKIEPFMVIGVLIILIIIGVQLYNGNELRKEISQNCGWGNEEFRCFCEKSEAMEIKRKIDNLNGIVGEVEDVQIDG